MCQCEDKIMQYCSWQGCVQTKEEEKVNNGRWKREQIQSRKSEFNVKGHMG